MDGLAAASHGKETRAGHRDMIPNAGQSSVISSRRDKAGRRKIVPLLIPLLGIPSCVDRSSRKGRTSPIKVGARVSLRSFTSCRLPKTAAWLP